MPVRCPRRWPRWPAGWASVPEPVQREAITIRRARLSDASALAAIMGDPEVARGLMQLPWGSEAAWQDRLAASKPDKTTGELFIVAERNGQVLGSSGLHPEAAVRRRHVAHFGISVARAHWGTGVGSALLEAICQFADQWAQVLRIELTVFADNAPAIALYRKSGFVVEGRHAAYALRDGRYEDVLAMARLHPNPPRLPVPEPAHG